MVAKLSIKKSNLIQILVFLLNFGLPIFMVIPIISGTNTTPYMILLRLIILIVSAILVLFSGRFKTRELNIITVSFFVFWFFYLLRIIADVFIHPIIVTNENTDLSKVVSFAVFMCFLPSCAIYLNRSKINLEVLSGKLLLWFFVESFIVFCLLVVYFQGNIFDVFNDRSLITHGELFFPINPITISRIGASLVMASVYSFSVFHTLKWWKFLIFFLFGFVLLALGGSRGPIISLAAVLLLLSARSFYKIKLYINVILIILMVVFTSTWVDFSKLDVISRIVDLQSGENFDRLGHWNSAVNQFLENPVFGDKIFDNYLGTYPHNILLEVLMSVGLIGVIFFGLFTIPLIIRSIHLILFVKGGGGLIGALFLLYFFFSLSSSSLYFSVEFWCFTALLLFVPIRLKGVARGT